MRKFIVAVIIFSTVFTLSACGSGNSGETVTITISGAVDHTVLGEYEIVYTSEDYSGNMGTKTRYINVIE